jgi:2-polyprenyl-3-methyl-5-hydroxy-6-metoxy-1,4-benzoquinol methylase
MNNSNPSEKLHRMVEEINERGGSYHKFDLGDNLVINGTFDMTKYLHCYGIPMDLTGKTVLDIGTSSGFFAFERVRRKAQVTAIDLWDGTGFNSNRDVLGLDVRYVQKSSYELDLTFGQFDLVICGSLLLHLADIFRAIERIRSVCRGEAIIATAAMDDHKFDDKPFCEFVGSRTLDGLSDYYTFWRLNGTALMKMVLAAGFSESVFNKIALGHQLWVTLGYGTPQTVPDRPERPRMGFDPTSGTHCQARWTARA